MVGLVGWLVVLAQRAIEPTNQRANETLFRCFGVCGLTKILSDFEKRSDRAENLGIGVKLAKESESVVKKCLCLYPETLQTFL